jgi:hypothetical protein
MALSNYKSVAISTDGNFIIVGSNITNKVPYIYSNVNVLIDQWVIYKQLTSVSNCFSVGINYTGSTVIVGAINQYSSNYVKIFNSSDYSQTVELIPSKTMSVSSFGWALDLSSDGTRAVVGAPFNSTQNSYIGNVGIYSSITGDLLYQLIPNPIVGANGWFGASVNMSGDGSNIIVGAPFGGQYGGISLDNISQCNNIGYVGIYSYSSTMNNYSSCVDLDTSGFSNMLIVKPQFGTSVSISYDGNIACVGAPFAYNNGCVRLYNTTTGSILSQINNTSESFNSQFGWSVALNSDGSTCIVSSPLGSNYEYVGIFSSSSSSPLLVATHKYNINTQLNSLSNKTNVCVDISGGGNHAIIGSLNVNNYIKVLSTYPLNIPSLSSIISNISNITVRVINNTSNIITVNSGSTNSYFTIIQSIQNVGNVIWSNTQLPNGLTINSFTNDNIRLKVAPHTSNIGQNITINCSNILGLSQYTFQFISLNSTLINPPQLINPGEVISYNWDGPTTFSIQQSAIDVETITWSTTGLPSGVTSVSSNIFSNVFTVAQESSIVGDNITVSASNLLGNSSVTFKLIAYSLYNNIIPQLSNVLSNIPNAWFGYSVAISRDASIIAVGAPGACNYTGYVNLYNSSNQQFIKTIENSANGSNPFFGGSVALSGNGSIALIGAPLSGIKSYDGYVGIYSTLSNNTVVNSLINTAGSGGQFGSTIALSDDGKIAAIGAPFAYNGIGYAAIYSTETYSVLRTFISYIGYAGYFGFSVSISGDSSNVIVGAPNSRNGNGYAALYSSSNGAFIKEYINPLTDSSGFGWSVSLNSNGSNALIGAPLTNLNKGFVGYYSSSGNLIRQLLSTDTVSYGLDSSLFGISVSMNSDGTNALVGGSRPLNKPNSTRLETHLDGYGSIFSTQFETPRVGYGAIFSTQTGLVIKDFPSTSGANSRFGSSVALSGNGMNGIIGSPGANNYTGSV